MPAPLIPLALGAGALVFFFMRDDKKKKKKKTAAPAVDCVDAGMPIEFENALNSLLANEAIPASQLIAAAMIAETHNFSRAAACLREAAQARGGPSKAPPGFDPNDPTTWPAGLGIPFPSTQAEVPGAQPTLEPPGLGIPTVPGIPGFPGGLPPGGVTDVPCVLDGHMPAAAQDQVRALLASPQATPQILIGAAQIAAVNGFPLAAACLNAEATRRSAGIPISPLPGFDPLNPATWPQILGPTGPLSGAMEFTVRTGDRPVGLAQYYTGDGGRFRELEADNPQMGTITPGGVGVRPYTNWVPGLVIMLPASWFPTAKPIPPIGL